MTQSTASFIDQLELAATGQDIILESVEELIETVEEEIVKEEPVEEKKELFTGSVENAMEELSSLFEGTFAVSIPEEEPEEEVISIPQLVAEELNTGEERIEIVEEETPIEPTISAEAIDNATNELMDLFEVVAGIDLSTGEKIEAPVIEEPIPCQLVILVLSMEVKILVMYFQYLSLLQQNQRNKMPHQLCYLKIGLGQLRM